MPLPREFELAHTIPARTIAERWGVQMRQQGSRAWACCPLHREKTPSMIFFPDGGFKCWGCGAAGDSIDLYAAYYGIEKLEAAERICSEYGLVASSLPHDTEAEAMVKHEQEERACRESFVKSSHDSLAWAALFLRDTAPESWDDSLKQTKVYFALLHHGALINWLLQEIEAVPIFDPPDRPPGYLSRYEILQPYESVVTLIGQYRQLAGGTGRQTMGRHRHSVPGSS